MNCVLAGDISLLNSYFGVDGYRIVHLARDPLSLLVSAYQYHLHGNDCWNACPDLKEMRKAPLTKGLRMQARKLLNSTIPEQYAVAKLLCSSNVLGENILLGDFSDGFDAAVARLLDALLGDGVEETVKMVVKRKAQELDVNRWSKERRERGRHVHTGSITEKVAFETWAKHKAALEPEWTEIENSRKELFELLDLCRSPIS